MSTFSLAPTLILDSIIDYISDKGRKHFKRAIEPLSNISFSLNPKNQYLLADLLIERVQEIGWDLEEVGICAINTIPSDPDSPTINILMNHGELSLDTIREFEETYISTESRAVQDTFMIYKCIRNSLSTEAKRCIFI